MLCVALVIIVMAWSALCIATMTQCIVYERNTALWNDRIQFIDMESGERSTLGSRRDLTFESHQIGSVIADVISLEMAVRWCGVVMLLVFILSLSTEYDC